MKFTWKRCTEARFWEMLCVLPPAHQAGHGFLVGEPYSHRTCTVTKLADQPTFTAFLEHKRTNDFFEGQQAMTIAEFKALQRDDVVRNIVED